MSKNLNLKISKCKSFKYFKYRNIGKIIIGTELNLIKIAKIEKKKVKKKYSFLFLNIFLRKFYKIVNCKNRKN